MSRNFTSGVLCLSVLCVSLFVNCAEEKPPAPNPTASSEEPVDPDVLRKVRKLIRLTTSEDAAEREKAWNDIREMGNLITPGLLELAKIKETPPAMVHSILIALGDSKDPRAGPALVTLLKSPDASVRKNAARALGDSGYKAGLSALESVASDIKEEEDVRLFAAVSGTRFSGAKAVAALNELLKSGRPEIRSRAVFALGKFGGVAQVNAIASALKDSDLSVREDTVEALRLLKDKKAWAALIEATKDENFRVRSAAMDALRELTKKKFANDPKEWQTWWEKEKS